MRRNVVIVVLLAALAFRLALLFALPHYNFIEPAEMERTARSFAATGELANPYATPTGPTAHLLPVYPALLGTIYRIFGTGAAGVLVQGIWGCMLSALRCALLYPLVLIMGLSHRTALLSAVLSAVYIPSFATEIRGAWEAPLAALCLMGMVYLILHLMSVPTLRFPTAIGCGLYVGISALLSATLLFVAGGFVAAGVWFFRKCLRRYLAWSAVLCMLVVLCLAPWALRNRHQLGTTVWLRSNFGFELWQAYRDGAGTGALDTDVKIGPTFNTRESNRVRALGEVRYHKMLEREALECIRSHPRRAAQLFLAHAVHFWFPPATLFVFRLGRGLLTVVAACGMYWLLSRRIPAGAVIAGVWLLYPLIYYVVYWSSRYRYPMEWTLVVCASVAITAVWSRYRATSGRVCAG